MVEKINKITKKSKVNEKKIKVNTKKD